MLRIDKKRLGYMKSMVTKKLVHCNLQLLYECNFKCKICDFWYDEELTSQKMTLEQIKVIAEKIKPYGPQVVSIGGGEPLMHKDIVEITKVLGENNFPVMICNGWFMTEELATDLWNAGMFEVSISIDYASAAKHDEQRGVEGAYDRAVRALQILEKCRTSAYQRVHMITVVMEDTIDEIEDIIKLAKSIGVTYVVTLYSDKRGCKSNRHGDSMTSKLKALYKKYPDVFVSLPGYLENFDQASTQEGVGPCYAGRNLYNICYNGDVTLCIDTINDPVANIFTDSSEHVKKALFDKYKNNECTKCWTSCRGSIETLMYNKKKLPNFIGINRMTKDIPLKKDYEITY